MRDERIRRQNLEILWSEAERLGIKRLRKEPVWAISSGTFGTDIDQHTGTLVTPKIWINERMPDSVFILAHELGHARAALLDPEAIALVMNPQNIVCGFIVELEHEAWNLGEAILRRLRIPFDLTAFRRRRDQALQDYRKCVAEVQEAVNRGKNSVQQKEV